jgi:hypothetical protein
MWNLNGCLRTRQGGMWNISDFHISFVLCHRDQRKCENKEIDFNPQGFIPSRKVGSPWQSKTMRCFKLPQRGPHISLWNALTLISTLKRKLCTSLKKTISSTHQRVAGMLTLWRTVNAHEEKMTDWRTTGKTISPHSVYDLHSHCTNFASYWVERLAFSLGIICGGSCEAVLKCQGREAHHFRRKWSHSTLTSPRICREPHLGLISRQPPSLQL